VLRHLPPGTTFTRPTNQGEQRLLEELLLLPEDQEPLSWLIDQRLPEVATIALRCLLLSVRRAARSLQRTLDAGRTPLPELDNWVGPLLESHGADHAFSSDTALVVPDQPAELTALLHQLQHVYARSQTSGREPFPAGDEPRMSIELLRLPPTLDPVQWLATERTEWAAEYVFAILTNGRTAPGEPSTKITRHLQADLTAFSSLGVSIRIVSVDLLDDGFTILIRTEMTPQPDGAERVGYWFDGFDKVIDDRGCEYLQVNRRDDWRDVRDPETLLLSYYPAVAENVRWIPLSCQPARVRTGGINDLSLQGPKSMLCLGDVEWTITPNADISLA
jgi:hypothetical protein